VVDPDLLHDSRNELRRALAQGLKAEFLSQYRELKLAGAYSPDAVSAGKRALRNLSLGFLSELGMSGLAYEQLQQADNMTDAMAALSCLANLDCPERQPALDAFYEKWKHEPLVVDKWLTVQSTSRLPDTLPRVTRLLSHPAFDIKVPNKVYALIRGFASNHVRFHAADGSGYAFLADQVVGLPFVQLDRTGVALLGAIAIVGLEVLTPEQAALSIHLPTLLLLFSFMVLSAQMRLGGFYTWVTLRIAALPLAPPTLLAATMAAVAALSAVFSNDVVCLAVAPVLADACARRRLDPVPYLIGLACAANIGSAATLIGNPQNMLIGQVLAMHFAAYLREALLPVLLGLAAAWCIIAWRMAGTPLESNLPSP